jgi:hypothetical protein
MSQINMYFHQNVKSNSEIENFLYRIIKAILKIMVVLIGTLNQRDNAPLNCIKQRISIRI